MPPPRTSEPQPRLQEDTFAVRWLRSPAGAVLTRPWADTTSLYVLARWFFPLSRLWAAAHTANGSTERFFDKVPMTPAPALVPQLRDALARFEAERRAAHAAEDRWQEAFFGACAPAMQDLVAAETERFDRRDAYNRARGRFRFLLGGRRKVPPVRWDIPTPGDAGRSGGAAPAGRAALFAPPAIMPDIRESRRVAAPGGWEYWLRFRSPSAIGDEVFARVCEPEAVPDPPTMVLGHGICVEAEHWRGILDSSYDLCRAGVRVVRPEAPWHGRRVPQGRYGGEAFIARGPVGLVEGFAAQLSEWAVLIDWARRTSAGPVGVGGVSLGALTAQLLITEARRWPERLRPDAASLVTHCGDMAETATRSVLARAWGTGEAMRAKGWGPDDFARWFGALDPQGAPAMPPENIVSVLGSLDRVTPFDSGLALIDAWGVPQANRFIWRRGHFTVPMTLARDTRPLRRLAAILDRLK